ASTTIVSAAAASRGIFPKRCWPSGERLRASEYSQLRNGRGSIKKSFPLSGFRRVGSRFSVWQAVCGQEWFGQGTHPVVPSRFCIVVRDVHSARKRQTPCLEM